MIDAAGSVNQNAAVFDGIAQGTVWVLPFFLRQQRDDLLISSY